MGGLTRLMHNIGGPIQKNRFLYYKIIEAIVSYAAPAWGDALNYEYNRKRLRAVQKMGLSRVLRAYRSVSLSALNVIEGIPPIEMLLEEKIFKYEIYLKKRQIRANKRTENLDMLKKREEEIHKKTLEKWQFYWDHTEHGKWTNKLIPKIDIWLNRKCGPIGYHLMQALSGHGCFSTFLHKIGKEKSAKCWFCNHQDDAEHTLFICEKWKLDRDKLIKDLEIINWSADNMIETMIKSEDKWKKVNEFITIVMKEKENEERKREREKIRE